MVKRLADAELRFYWDDRGKRWTVSANYANGNQWRRIETSSALDQDGIVRLLDAVAKEMESWMF